MLRYCLIMSPEMYSPFLSVRQLHVAVIDPNISAGHVTLVGMGVGHWNCHNSGHQWKDLSSLSVVASRTVIETLSCSVASFEGLHEW